MDWEAATKIVFWAMPGIQFANDARSAWQVDSNAGGYRANTGLALSMKDLPMARPFP